KRGCLSKWTLPKLRPISREICVTIHSNGCACPTQICCFTPGRRKYKRRALQTWNCGSTCLKIALAFFLNVWQKRRPPRLLQSSDPCKCDVLLLHSSPRRRSRHHFCTQTAAA